MQHGGWMAEPRRCSADLKEDTPAGSHDHTRSLAQARATGLSYRIGDEGVVDRRCPLYWAMQSAQVDPV